MTRAHRARTGRVLALSAIVFAGLTAGLAPTAAAATHARPVAARDSAARQTAARHVLATAQAGVTSAQASAAAPQKAPARTLAGALTGTVLGAGQVPLGGACVTAGSGRTARTVTADSAGRYVIEGLTPGSYTIGFADCANPARYFGDWYGGSYTTAGAQHVIVLPGHSIALRPVSLRPADPQTEMAARRHALREHPAQVSASAPTISGTVLGPSGRRLTGICVTAWANVPDGQVGTSVTTGRRGNYTIGPDSGGLPGTKITVEFTNGGCFTNSGNYAPQWWKYSATEAKASTLSVPTGRHLKGIDARLAVGGEISGTVRAGSASGHLLRGICVQAVGTGEEPVFATATSGKNGRYVLRGLGTDRYELSFSTGCGNNGNYLGLNYPRNVRVTAGKTTDGINAVLQPGGTITGTVTTSGSSPAPLKGICVNAESGSNEVDGASTADGSFTLQQVPPGRYQLNFAGGCGNSGSYAPQYYPGQVSAESAALIRIRLGQTRTGLDASMAPGATISGRVTNRLGHGLGNVCAELLAPQDLGGFGPGLYSDFLGSSSSDLAATRSAGTYRIANLAPGPYYAQFSSCGNANLAEQWYSAAPHLTTASLISADAGSVTTGIDAVMHEGGTITGTVRGNGGKLLRAFCPIAFDPTGPTSLGFAIAVSFPPPNMHGHYRITGLSTGSYKVEFLPCFGGRYAVQWYRGKASEGSATPVKVRAGHVTAGINATLHAGQSVSGTVTSGDGKPLANVCVLANDAHGSSVGFALTGRTGRYVLAEMPPGSYTLQFVLCTQIPPVLAPATRSGVRVTPSRRTTGVSAVLRPGGSISGIVLEGVEGGGAPVPAPGICIEATPKTGKGIDTFTIADADGRYDVTGLAAGKYSLLFTAACLTGTQAVVPQRYPSLIRSGPGEAAASVNATLIADGQITGTVDGPGAQPLGGICVTAQPASGGAVPVVAPVVAVTTSTGSYSIGSLAPGSYLVKFSSGCGTTGYLTQWYDGAGSAVKATPVPVAPGQPTASVDATLSP